MRPLTRPPVEPIVTLPLVVRATTSEVASATITPPFVVRASTRTPAGIATT
ncbi:MAG: hypothetical protein ACXWZ4_14495 [Gemmatirosa sp.]